MIRVGLVGYGRIAAAVHAPALRRLRAARLVAIAEPDPDARRRAARIRGVAVGEDAGWLVGRGDIDAVVVCSPSGTHAEAALAALAAGLHVYIEKPIAITLADGRRIVEAASDAGVVAATGFNRRLHPLHSLARRLVEEGAIGSVESIRCRFTEPAPAPDWPAWKRSRATGGGVLLDLASHHVDLVRWLLRTEIAEVEATVESALSDGDTAQLRLRTVSGIEADGFFAYHGARGDLLELEGDAGTIRIDRYGWALEVLRSTAGSVSRVRLPSAWKPSMWRLRRLVSPGNDPSWRAALATFVAAADGGARHGLAGAEDGLRSLEVILAAEESARSSARVPVPSS